MSMVKSLCLAGLLPAGITLQAQTRLQLFPLQAVQITDPVFKKGLETDLQYVMALDADRLLAPYRREAGLPARAESYTNWERAGLDGHIGGHFLSALALLYRSTGDKRTLEKLTYCIDELALCQQAFGDGYVGAVPGSKAYWAGIRKGDLALQSTKWVPLYNIHKVFAGLRDAWEIAGITKAKDMYLHFADWFVALSNDLGPDNMQRMLDAEHGGINEVLADAYAETGNRKYLDAAYQWSHQRILKPLAAQQDQLDNLHANTQIPKIVGFDRVAQLSGDSNYYRAAVFFWNQVVQERSVSIGGNSVREHFNPLHNFSGMVTSEQGPESCNSYNMLKLTKGLFLQQPQGRLIDYYERTLYNHLLSTQLPGKGGFVYFTPMRAGHYRIYSQPQTSMWCCVGSGIETHAKYGELVYAHDNDQLYINLFMSSTLTWSAKNLVLEQHNRFPEKGASTLLFKKTPTGPVTLMIRKPAWVKPGAFAITVNGKQWPLQEKDGYVAVRKKWTAGDRIGIALPMHLYQEAMHAEPDQLSFCYGPLVLAAKKKDPIGAPLFADDSRMGHVANGPLEPLSAQPVLVSAETDLSSQWKPVSGKPLHFLATGNVYPKTALELLPFNQVDSSRYIIYWQRVKPENLAARIREKATADSLLQWLRSRTIDAVTAGEQQPEADHQVKTADAWDGIDADHHWRAARGFVSYVLNDPGLQADSLRLQFVQARQPGKGAVFINGKKLSAYAIASGDQQITLQYALPEKSRSMEIRLEAEEGFNTGKLTDVRLLKQ